MSQKDSIHIYKFAITLAISVSELKNLDSPEVGLKANLQFTLLNAKSTSGIPLVVSLAFANLILFIHGRYHQILKAWFSCRRVLVKVRTSYD